MTILSMEDLAARLAPGDIVAGLDLGTTTIGLSLSDKGRRLATPRPVINRKKFSLDADILLAFAAREEVEAFIIGLPINMDGSQGPRAQATRAFVRNMEQKTPIPFAFWDERLSTVAAERALIEMDVSRRKRSERIDSAAASFILQGALDRLSSLARDASSET
ncbi:MAG: Holliday junction resolvase RuvX [Rhizobiaceae bacterium]|nr:Holliday junction resolvase RuvX [Rhizobiaceae bacterium]